MTGHMTAAALALALALPGAPAFAQKAPTTYAEAMARMEAWVPRRPSYRSPPGNVRAEDYRELFGDRVIVIDQEGAPDQRHRVAAGTKRITPIKIVFMGRDGRYLWCWEPELGTARHAEDAWEALRVRRSEGMVPLIDNTPESRRGRGVLVPLYEAETGRVIFHTAWRRKWWDWNIGHIQERLPASTWDACPDFPPAAELGLEVNERQTSPFYDEMVAQDPGRRVLRPDLVTPDPVDPLP